MFGVRYKGLRIEVTKAAARELVDEAMTLYDVVEVLEDGYCVKKRAPGVEEKRLRKGNKLITAVVVAKSVRFEGNLCENVWLLIHAGKTTYKEGR